MITFRDTEKSDVVTAHRISHRYHLFIMHLFMQAHINYKPYVRCQGQKIEQDLILVLKLRYTYNLTIGYISNLTIGCIFIHTCHTCQVYILAYLYILANYKSCKIGSKLICQWIKTLHDQSVNLLIYQKCTLSYKVFLII